MKRFGPVTTTYLQNIDVTTERIQKISPKIEDVRIFNSKFKENAMRELSKQKNIKKLQLWSCNLSAEQLKPLFRMTNLVYLLIYKNEVHDLVGRIAFITQLGLCDCNINDQSLKDIATLPKVTTLYLNKNNITEKGVGYLKKLTQIQNLCLSDNFIDDQGAHKLSSLLHLNELWLNGNKLTFEGISSAVKIKILTLINICVNPIGNVGVGIMCKQKKPISQYQTQTTEWGKLVSQRRTLIKK